MTDMRIIEPDSMNGNTTVSTSETYHYTPYMPLEKCPNSPGYHFSPIYISGTGLTELKVPNGFATFDELIPCPNCTRKAL